MPEIDPVVLQLLADTDRYRSELRATTRTVDQQLGLQERRVKRLENEFRNSSGAIGNSLRGLAGVLATAFTGRELVGLIDSFTRLQNSLRVAGLEGQALADVQGRLLELSGRYGVSIEGLADLYGKATDAGRSFGASEAQVLQLTEAVSQSLLITGTSATQAQGALLGLSQALASGTVRAEEFNQVNEGGLRPLLQAAAASERFAGDVNKLRAAVLDGTVSSQEFFAAILAGSAELEGRASKATLTLSGAFEALTSQLVVYFGEAGQASGVTAALASAIQALADNLDVIIPALAIIATALGVGFVTNAARASLAAQATTVSMATLATTARGAGLALLAAFGGPVGIAITAVAVGIGYVASQAGFAEQNIARLRGETDELRVSNDELAKRLTQAGVAVDGLGNAAASASSKVDGLNTSMGIAINTALQLSAQLAQLEVVQMGMQRGVLARQRDGLAEIGGDIGTINALTGKIQELDRGIALRTAAAKNGVSVAPAPKVAVPGASGGGSEKAKRSGGGRKGPTGPSAEEIANRFNSELASIAQQTLSAQARLATSAEERAELELRSIELARLRTLNEIEADADYSAAQKERLAQQVEALAESERETVEIAKRAEIERAAQDIADERARAEADGLRLQYELADTQDERRAIALQILEAEDRYLQAKLQAIITANTINDIQNEEAKRAQIQLDALNASTSERRDFTLRQNETALERYGRDSKDVNKRVEEAAARRIADLNQTIADTMARELGIKDPFISQLLQIFLDRAIFGPLAEALSNAGSSGGGGGFFSSIVTAIGSIFGGGRASGGFTAPGKLYRVNEGASPGRVEGFMPTGSGKIIPLGQMNAMQPGGSQAGGVVVVRLALSGDIDAKIDQRAAGVAVEVVRQGAPQIIDAAANETQRRFSRPTL